MFSYLNNAYIQLIRTNTTMRNDMNFNKPDVLKQTGVYDSLNWSKTVVGGSYALEQFTGAKWKSNDIDIFMSADTKEEFEEMYKNFEKKTGAKLLKENKDGVPSVNVDDSFDWNEDFTHLIKGTRTYQVPECDKPIQLIHLDGTKPEIGEKVGKHSNVGPVEILQETTDLPSCVSYTVINGQRVFHIPEKGREALFTKRVNSKEVCGSRKQKYEERGYLFFD